MISEDRTINTTIICLFSILFPGKPYIVFLMIPEGSGYIYTCSSLIQRMHNVFLRTWSKVADASKRITQCFLSDSLFWNNRLKTNPN